MILYFIDLLPAVGVMGTFTPVPYAFERYRPFVLVIVYVALSIYSELHSDRFLAALAENDAAPPRAGVSPRRRGR